MEGKQERGPLVFNVLVEADVEGVDPGDAEDEADCRRRKFYVLEMKAETFSEAAGRAEDTAAQGLAIDGLTVHDLWAVDVRRSQPAETWEFPLGLAEGSYIQATREAAGRLQVRAGNRRQVWAVSGHLKGNDRALLRLLV